MEKKETYPHVLRHKAIELLALCEPAGRQTSSLKAKIAKTPAHIVIDLI